MTTITYGLTCPGCGQLNEVSDVPASPIGIVHFCPSCNQISTLSINIQDAKYILPPEIASKVSVCILSNPPLQFCG